MSTQVLSALTYPDSDGEPIAGNTKQFQWIVTIQGNLETLLPGAFVAGDLLWYPVEGRPDVRLAPDILVAFGRPGGHRGSYRQWEENGVAPQVVFEILSPGNRAGEMQRKLEFYERHSVEEYYLYDPDDFYLSGWIRDGEHLRLIDPIDGFSSPRLGVRFETDGVSPASPAAEWGVSAALRGDCWGAEKSGATGGEIARTRRRSLRAIISAGGR